MKKTFFSITLGSCFLFGCSNSNEPKGTESTISSDTSIQNTVTTGLDTAAQVLSTGNSSAITPAGLAAAPGAASSPATQPAAVTAPGMNPPHGEPNHRCDIAVGAPLNSPPGNGAPPANQGLNVSAPSNLAAPGTAPATPTVTAPGMNPPHGEPGHDCAIPVGSPLKK